MKRVIISLIALVWFSVSLNFLSCVNGEAHNMPVVKAKEVSDTPLSNYHNDLVDYWTEQYAKQYDVPAKLMASIFYQESNYKQNDPKYNAHVVGDGGRSFGPGQVQIRTAKTVWKDSTIHITGKTLKYDIRFNVETSVKLVSILRDKYAWQYRTEKEVWLAVLTAYNAGEAHLAKYKRFNGYAFEVYNRYKQS